jgi:uncharacterized protein DUF6902
MTNIIHLNVPFQRQTQEGRCASLIANFAQNRRFEDDVFWLKENAELLNILECTEVTLDASALAPLQHFYDRAEQQLSFFPQYYRFLLSICLDLEDLGLPGSKGEQLAGWVARQELPEAELSDLQRGEAQRLLQRRGEQPLTLDAGLDERLHKFINRSQTFAVPNKKAAYELTHIVFYLSEYGRRDPQLDAAAITSLEYAGLLAYLDQNADLLAEICIALRYSGQTPSALWETWIEQEVAGFAIEHSNPSVTADEYHDYFVCNWLLSLRGTGGFMRPMIEGPVSFHRQGGSFGALRGISEAMFHLDDARSGDWHVMGPRLEQALCENSHKILRQAQLSSRKFDSFFANFARVPMPELAS